MPAQPITGTPATPALSVRFQDGQADVHDESIVDMMLKHPGFNYDFIAVDDRGTDPYAHVRQSNEPDHVTQEIKYGHVVSRSVPVTKTELPPEIKKLIAEQATALAQEMVKDQLPGLVAETLKTLSATVNQDQGSTVENATTPGDTKEQAVKPKTKDKK